MDHGVLGKQLVSLYKNHDEQTMASLLKKSLDEFRPQTLAQLQVLMPTVDGKIRLKILEILMEDGGEDLVPFFIQTIRMEKNSLYAKSMILVFGNFEIEAAASALTAIEGNLTSDLKSTVQRVVARFRARFREYFYMTEFESAIQKRMKFASGVMIKEPHEKYIPFLNNHLNSSVLALKFESIRVLTYIGDASSLEALFKLLETSLNQKKGETAFKEILAGMDREKLDVGQFIRSLASGMGFTYDTLLSVFDKAKRGTPKPFIQDVIEGFFFQSETLERALENFLKMIVLGSPLTQSDYRRLEDGLADYDKQLIKTLSQALAAMGGIAVRHPIPDLLTRVDELLPARFPNREYQMMQLLKGFKTDESFQRFLAYLSDAGSPEIVLEALDGLLHFESETLPDVVRDLALSPKRADIRDKAVQVVGNWGFADLIMYDLLDSSNADLKSCGVALICEFQPAGGQDLLLKLLSPKTPTGLLKGVLEALVAYPGEKTGRAILPFVDPKSPYEVRQIALITLIKAGGDHRFGLFFSLLKGLDQQKTTDMLSSMLSILKKIETDVWEAALQSQHELWPSLLNHEIPKFRDAFFILLESCSWNLENYAPWIKNLEKAVAQKIPRGAMEDKRLNGLISKLKELQDRAIKCDRANKVLNEIYKTFDAGDAYNRTQAMRRLSMAFKPEMAEDPENSRKINDMVCMVLDDSTSSEELLRLTVSAVSRIDHPDLVKRMEKFVNHENAPLSQSAREILLSHAEKPEGGIQKIFIIDDSKYMTKQLTIMLLKAGYKVIAENHVKEGLLALSRDSFDLMILDLNMPEMDGARFLQTVRNAQMAPEHILVMSSTRDREELGAIVQQGIEGLFLKPFPMNELLDKIRLLEAA